MSVQSVPILSWLLPMAAHAFLLCAMLGRMIYSGPRFRRLFDDFGMQLPHYSQFVTDVTTWVATYWLVTSVAAMGMIAADCYVIWRVKGTRLGRLWGWGVLACLLSLWALVELAWLLPAMKLLDALKADG